MLQGIHITFFEVGEAASSWFTVFITLDRLIAMVFISRYRTLGYNYVKYIIGFVSLYTLADVVASFVGSYLLKQVKKSTARCGHPQNVPDYYYQWHTMQIICCGYISIVIYVCAIIVMKLKRNNNNSEVLTAQIKRESTVTKRIARIVLTTFILQILPLTIYTTDISNEYFFDLIGPYVWGVYALTPSVNVFIYSSNNPDFRSKLKKLLLCKPNQVGLSTISNQTGRNTHQR